MKRFSPARLSHLIPLLLGFVQWNCGDDDSGSGSVSLSLEHRVDGAELVLDDQLRYANAAGNQYSVSKLEYLLTDIALEKANGQRIALAEQHYCAAADPASRILSAASVPAGSYERLVFTFGVDEEDNAAGALPNTAVYNNMLWPEAMGGGYHYMKFEGLYRAGDEEGAFAVHTGPSGGGDFSLAISLPLALTVEKDAWNIHLTMNLNEWFTGTEDYNFAGLGGIMGNAALQGLLQSNGGDAFRLATPEPQARGSAARLLSP